MNTAYTQESEVKEITLRQGVLTIGRAETNDIVIPLKTISLQHAKITTFFGAANIQDLSSTNGIYVNGKQVKQAILNPGDSVYVGEFHFIIAGFEQV